MFRLRTAFATLALIIGLGSTCDAQMINLGVGGIGQSGFYGGYGGFQPGFGGFQSGFVGQQFGIGVGALPYGYGYDAPYYPTFNNYYVPIPQTYNTMGSLMDSIQMSTSRCGGWRRLP